MLDVGGESTRPGARRVPAAEQISRVVPIIEAIRACQDPVVASIPISVDTTLAEVARAAIDAGADAINDVSGASEDPRLLAVAAESGAGLVLMHRAAAPPHDHYADEHPREPDYEGGVLCAVCKSLEAQAQRALAAGISRGSLVVDPGLGFGKSVDQNMLLVRGIDRLASMGLPVYVGASRKRFIGRISGAGGGQPADRLGGSIAVTILAAQRGALLHRVHDVAEQVQALSMLEAGGQKAGDPRE